MLEVLKKNVVISLITIACVIYYIFLSVQSLNYLLPVSESEAFFFSVLGTYMTFAKLLNFICFGVLIFSLIKLFRMNNISWNSGLLVLGCFFASPLVQNLFMEINLQHVGLTLGIWSLIIIYSKSNSPVYIGVSCLLLLLSFFLTGNYIYLLTFGLAPLLSIQSKPYIICLLIAFLIALWGGFSFFQHDLQFVWANVISGLKILFAHWAYFLLIVLLIPVLRKLTLNIKHPCVVLIFSGLFAGIFLTANIMSSNYIYLVLVFAICWLLALALEAQKHNYNQSILFKIFACIFAFSLIFVSNQYLVVARDNSLLAQNTQVFIESLQKNKDAVIYSENIYLHTKRKGNVLLPKLIKDQFYNNIILLNNSPKTREYQDLIDKHYLIKQQIKLSNNIYNVYYPKQAKYTQSKYISSRYKGLDPHNIRVSF